MFADKNSGVATRYRRTQLVAWNEVASDAMREMIAHAPVYGDANHVAHTEYEGLYRDALREAAKYRAGAWDGRA